LLSQSILRNKAREGSETVSFETVSFETRKTGRKEVEGGGREREMGRREETRAEKIKGGLKSGD